MKGKFQKSHKAEILSYHILLNIRIPLPPNYPSVKRVTLQSPSCYVMLFQVYYLNNKVLFGKKCQPENSASANIRKLQRQNFLFKEVMELNTFRIILEVITLQLCQVSLLTGFLNITLKYGALAGLVVEIMDVCLSWVE